MAEMAQQDVSTVLGPDSNFKGELTVDKGIRIHGRFEGKIATAGRVHVAKEAKLQAEVDAGSIVVEGEIHGSLSASERLELKSTARYEGDLRASRMTVEEGAVFSGQVNVGPEAVKKQPAVPGAAIRSGNGPIPVPPLGAALVR